MTFFGVGSTTAAPAATGSSIARDVEGSTHPAAATHPSAPIPVQGPPVGHALRVALGESGLDRVPADPRRGGVRLERRPRIQPRDPRSLRRARRQRRAHRRQLRGRSQRAHRRASGSRRAACATTSCWRRAWAVTPTTPGSVRSTSCASVEASLTRLRHRPHRRALPRRRGRLRDGARRHPRDRRVARRVWQGARDRRRSGSPPSDSSRRASSRRPATRASRVLDVPLQRAAPPGVRGRPATRRRRPGHGGHAVARARARLPLGAPPHARPRRTVGARRAARRQPQPARQPHAARARRGRGVELGCSRCRGRGRVAARAEAS